MNPDCRQIRKNIVRVSHHSGHGHIPTCFSVVELLVAAYGNMKHDPRNPGWKERDIFILSKGHAALGHYCVLSHLGYFPCEELDTFGAFRSKFGCHADRAKIPGIEASTGSLGHGIGIAVGVALGKKLNRAPERVFTLIGDGEANEGSVWESVMVSNNLHLDNLTILYDDNRSHVRGLQIQDPASAFRAFGCTVCEVDGHSIDEISAALKAPAKGVKAVVARTVKGYGSKLLTEHQHEWHRKSPNTEQLSALLEELDAEAV